MALTHDRSTLELIGRYTLSYLDAVDKGDTARADALLAVIRERRDDGSVA